MQSNGGLADAHRFRGKDSILSGPAGGIVGMARTAAAAGFGAGHRLRHGRHLDRRVALRRGVRAAVRDRGGRGPDARADAEHPHRRGGRRLDPALRRQPVPGRPGLGGGGPRTRVLPPRRPAHRDRRQRGARPHPARLLPPGVRLRAATSRWTPGSRPRGSPTWPGGSPRTTGDQRSGAEVAAGFLDIAVANMANAIKKISVQRGYDVTRYVLATFGGAGGQHACAVADALGMTSVLIHPLAGVLSAYGMGLADVTLMREAAVEEELSGGLLGRLDRVAGDLEAAAPGRAGQAGGRPRWCGPRWCSPLRAPGPAALPGHRHRAARPARCGAGHAGGLRGGLPAALLVPDAGQADRRRVGLRRADRGSGSGPGRFR